MKTRLLLLLMSLCSLQAQTYDFDENPLDGTVLRWRGRWPLLPQIRWKVNGGIPAVRNAIREQVQQWEDATDFAAFEIFEDRQNPNVTVTYGVFPDLTYSAYCLPIYDSQQHSIVGAEIVINSAFVSLRPNRRLLWIVLHEFGHALGLSHSNVPGSVMFPKYGNGEEPTRLTADDIACIRDLYDIQGNGPQARNRRHVRHWKWKGSK